MPHSQKSSKAVKPDDISTPADGSSSAANHHPVKGIDHVFILAKNLEKSADCFRRLGFTLSPRGLHSKEQGTANYTVVFPDDYFELLGIVEETPANRDKKHNLETYGEGLYAIAGRIGSALATKESLAELGFDITEVQNFSRPVELPDGKTGIAAFSTVAFNKSEVPNGQVFMCEHKSRDMVWQPELMIHKNGAIGLKAITLLSSSPEEAGERYARLFKDGKVKQEDDSVVVTTGKNSADIRILSEESYQHHFPFFVIEKIARNAYAGLAIYVNDLGKTKRALELSAIPFNEINKKHIVIAPEYATGTVLEFFEKVQ